MARIPVLAVVLAGLVAALSYHGSSATAQRAGEMQVICLPSHSAHDDPIVFPGAPGMAHLHEFFGNRGTDAFSTADTLRGGETTCKGEPDTAAYWLPQPYINGAAVAVDRAIVYYTRFPGTGYVESVPAGLQMIGGNSAATAPPAKPDVISFDCFQQPTIQPTTYPQKCPVGSPVQLKVRFPHCWSGKSLDRFSVTYGKGNVCPAAFPHPLPHIRIAFKLATNDPTGLTFAGMVTNPDGSMTYTTNKPYYTLHADFINSWTQSELDALLREHEVIL